MFYVVSGYTGIFSKRFDFGMDASWLMGLNDGFGLRYLNSINKPLCVPDIEHPTPRRGNLKFHLLSN
jgi:hypothetical protein